ncbi:MAG: hypothetical protein LBV00_09100, partial [Propionibacteriaceae bacterium]|nr:hypothetical protein [Propionibacteriaceae bacterium]
MRLRHLCAAVGVALAMLTGCTPDLSLPDPPASAGSSQATTPPQSSSPSSIGSDAGVTRADLPEMATVTADAGATDAHESAGGTVTAILRSVEASGDVLTVNFAVQWDDPSHSDSATAKDAALGLELSAIMVVDPSTLTGYRPFCATGSYKAGGIDRQNCLDSMLVSPKPESIMG